jgi:hypothetical protein
MKILISADAERDLIEGARFYDSLEAGLGDHFVDSLLSDIDRAPLSAQRLDKDRLVFPGT